MKISLALGPRRPLSRQTAWGCLTANVALPGSGSLMAGRVSGYPQLFLALGGTVMSTVSGLPFFVWAAANWTRFYGAEADAFTALKEKWGLFRWALLGLGIFGLSWLWGVGTGFQILYSSKNVEGENVPPRLNSGSIPPKL
jgi:hypothetical protein